jgi:hypothetical protein
LTYCLNRNVVSEKLSITDLYHYKYKLLSGIWVINKFKLEIPTDILMRLKAVYAYSDFDTSGCQILYEKINQ